MQDTPEPTPQRVLQLAMLDTLRAIVGAPNERERAELRLELATIVHELQALKGIGDGEKTSRHRNSRQ